MNIKKIIGSLIIFFGLIAFIGCDGQKSESTNVQKVGTVQAPGEPAVLKSYKVPERLVEEVCQTINALLQPDISTKPPSNIKLPDSGNKPPKLKLGEARIAPDGLLLVIAPMSFHDGIKDFIEQLEKNNPAPSPSVEVNYWIVAGREAKTPAELDEFNRIKPALETIQNNQGNMEFKLLDHVVLTSSNQGTPTRVGGAVVRITQMFSAYSDGTLAIQPSIDMMGTTQGNINSIQTNIETKSGELVVLGQSSQGFLNRSIFEPGKEGEKTHFETVNVYYIISADVKK